MTSFHWSGHFEARGSYVRDSFSVSLAVSSRHITDSDLLLLLQACNFGNESVQTMYIYRQN